VVAAVAEDTALSGSRDEDNTETPEKPEPVAEAIETAAAVENKADEAMTDRVEEQDKVEQKTEKEVIEDIPFEAGDTVVGTFMSSNKGGTRVRIETGGVKGLYGFMPEKEGPQYLKTAKDPRRGSMRPQRGLRREFMVCKIPNVVHKDGFGPLLSARIHDDNLQWQRLRQMREACKVDLATFDVPIMGSNPGGLRTVVQGIHGFVPFSALPREKEGDWWTEENARAKYSGKVVKGTIKDIRPEKRSLVISISEALQHETMKQISPGSLITGKIWQIKPYGCMVNIDNTSFSGLLHISAISNAHVADVEDVFAEGDRVTCVVYDMEDNWARISLACRDLERYHGEMMDDKEACFRDAAETMGVAPAASAVYDEHDGSF